MKLVTEDIGRTTVYICPETGRLVTDAKRRYSDGACHICGHVDDGIFTHAYKRKVKYKSNKFLGITYKKTYYFDVEDGRCTT